MEPWVIAVSVCGLYLIASLVMGIIPGLKVSDSVSGYVAGDQSMNTIVLYFVIGASVFSSFAFLGGPGWAYSRGMAALFIIAYGTIGMVPLYFFGPRARRLGIKHGFVTQAELLAHRFSNKGIAIFLALISIVVFVPYLTLQMKGAGYILNVISEGRIPIWGGAAITYFVVLLYVLFSGVMGVGWTNTFQGVFMLVIAWFLGLYLPYKLYGGVGEMFNQIEISSFSDMLKAPGLTSAGEPWSWAAYTSTVLVSAVGFSVWPHFFMKSYAAKSEKSLKMTVVLYPTFQLFLVPILLIGFAAILSFPDVTPADTILPYILTQIDLSPVLIGLICAGTLAASMSSGDAILHAAASIGIRDGVRNLKTKMPLTDHQERQWIRILVVIISVISYYFAVVSEIDIVSLLLYSYGGVAQIFPIIFAAFYWPRANRYGALSGLIGGISVSVFFLICPDLKPWPIHEGIYGLGVNVLLLIVVSLRTPAEPVAVLKEYFPSLFDTKTAD